MTSTLHAVASLDEAMGGSVRAALDTTYHLGRHGERAFVAATTSATDSLDYLKADYQSVDHALFPQRFPRHYFRSPALRRWLRRHVTEFDVVELHGVFSFVPLYAAWACVRAGTPFTVRPHGSLDPFDLQKHAVLKQFYGRLVVRYLLNRAGCVLLTSKQEADRMETYGSDPVRIVIPLPVERPPSMGDGPGFRRQHEIPEDALVVLFLGRVDQKKGLQFLIPALAHLKEDYPRLWFVLVGAGDSTANDLAASLLLTHGISGWTSRCGFLAGQAKRSAFAAADVFALPSLNENLGITIIEAMQAGVPVMISDQVYIHDLLLERRAALVCKPTIRSCGDTLRRLLESPSLRRAQAERASTAASALFDPVVVMPQLRALYRQLASS